MSKPNQFSHTDSPTTISHINQNHQLNSIQIAAKKEEEKIKVGKNSLTWKIQLKLSITYLTCIVHFKKNTENNRIERELIEIFRYGLGNKRDY